MKLALMTAAAAGACLLGFTDLGSSPVQAQTTAAAPAAGADADVDPEALAALARMGDYLRTLQSFEMRADTSIDEAIDDQVLTFDGTVTYKMRRPNGLYVEMASDRKVRQIFYDGKQVTIYSPRMKLYASVAAPPTIREMLKEAEDKRGIVLPITDLFVWGTPDARTDDLITGNYIGPAKCGDAICDHFAFQETDLDWQIWIQQGAQPLPRKVVITTKLGDANPQFTARLNWTVNPTLSDATFAFVPPAEAHAIKLVAAAE